MRVIGLVSILLLAACSKGAAEEKKYDMVKQGAIRDRAGQLCEQAKRVSAAYLEDADQDNYRLWQTKIINDCR